jgi:hypothetical protein
MNSQKRPAPRGDVEHPDTGGINPQRMKIKKMKNL